MTQLFAPSATLSTIDPRKRVRYSNGLVLGLDEFLQEQTYFLAKHRNHARSLHGYGVVCGLDVDSRGDPDPEIVVSPGMALNPRGQTMTVDQDYCLRVNAWLALHQDEIEAARGSPPVPASPDILPLYLVLCHRECETDIEPIPAGPCQSLDKVTAPTRIADDFQLDLRFTPPDQTEEDAIRALGSLLRSIEVAPGPGVPLTLDEFLDLIRALAPGGVTPASPMPGSPGADLLIHPDDADAFLRAAMETWVSDVRPALLPDGRNCHNGPPAEGCILLAEIAVPLDLVAGDFRVNGPLAIDTEERPILLQTRLLQERFGFSGGAGGVTDHAALTGLAADDHPHYLLVDPATRALVTDLDADGNRITSLAPGAVSGHAVEFDQAIKVGDGAGGDLNGTYPNPQVVRLRGRPVAAAAPSVNDVLTWTGTRWTPQPAAAGDTGNFETGLTVLRALSWVHSGNSSFALELDGNRVIGVALQFSNRVQVRPGSLDANSFQIFVELAGGGLIQIARGGAVVIPVSVTGTQAATDIEGNPVEVITRLQTAPPVAEAALLRFDDAFSERLTALEFARTRIVLHGDVIRDSDDRAVDTEFLRANLRTGSGDRPEGAELGLQGGRFESWVAFRQNTDVRLDINNATADDLRSLTGVGDATARNILDFRRENGRITAENLATIPGVTRVLVNRLRNRLIFG